MPIRTLETCIRLEKFKVDYGQKGIPKKKKRKEKELPRADMTTRQ